MLQRAAEMPIGEAKEYMRVHFLRLGFEMSGFCPGCVLDAQTMLGGSAFSATFKSVRETEEVLQAVGDPAHVCTVIPIGVKFRASIAAGGTVFDLGAKYDSEKK